MDWSLWVICGRYVHCIVYEDKAFINYNKKRSGKSWQECFFFFTVQLYCKSVYNSNKVSWKTRKREKFTKHKKKKIQQATDSICQKELILFSAFFCRLKSIDFVLNIFFVSLSKKIYRYLLRCITWCLFKQYKLPRFVDGFRSGYIKDPLQQFFTIQSIQIIFIDMHRHSYR